MFTEELNRVGYISRSVPTDKDLRTLILELKKQKNAVILAHYYVTAEIQELADVVGDSLALAHAAKKTDADIILFCGVHFMAETAKILNPSKKVLLPDLNAGCSLADSTPAVDFEAFKSAHPGAVVVSYINCSAEVKAMSDIICTSSNAVEVVNSIPSDKKIIFAPDKNLGTYVAKQTGRDLILWDGACVVHVNISIDKLIALQTRFPEAQLIAHPECESEILNRAHFIGSTKALIEYAKVSPVNTFIIATEAGILYKMRELVPEKKLIPAPALETNSCACSECPYMKMNTLEKVFNALYYELPEITLSDEIIKKASVAMNNMMALK